MDNLAGPQAVRWKSPDELPADEIVALTTDFAVALANMTVFAANTSFLLDFILSHGYLAISIFEHNIVRAVPANFCYHTCVEGVCEFDRHVVSLLPEQTLRRC